MLGDRKHVQRLIAYLGTPHEKPCQIEENDVWKTYYACGVSLVEQYVIPRLICRYNLQLIKTICNTQKVIVTSRRKLQPYAGTSFAGSLSG